MMIRGNIIGKVFGSSLEFFHFLNLIVNTKVN
jgi:hypothetical protein